MQKVCRSVRACVRGTHAREHDISALEASVGANFK
jgi:hypothetical protein